jgi:pimeloyl-ACP methyl ester carboxylesterase
MQRRHFLGASTIALAGVGASAKDAIAQSGECVAHPNPATFVLIPGAWCGGFVYSAVADILRHRGHSVFTPTLSGLGERSNLLSTAIDLTTHITDIVNVVRYNELEGVVLAGHSYGGIPITGAADQIPEAIGSLVYLDAFVPQDGQSASGIANALAGPPADLDPAAPQLGEPPLAFPMPAEMADQFGIPAGDRWKYTPMPLRAGEEPIRLTGAYQSIAKKTYVWASRNVQFKPLFDERRETAGWRTAIVDSNHMLMIDAPEQTAIVLEEAI